MLIWHWTVDSQEIFPLLFLRKSVVHNKSGEMAWHELLQMLQYNKSPVSLCPLFIYFWEDFGYFSWALHMAIISFTNNDTQRQTCLPLCSVCFPPESTPLGSIPVGVRPFSVSTLSLSSLQKEKNKDIILFLSPLPTLGLCPLCQQFTSAAHRTRTVTIVNRITCI